MIEITQPQQVLFFLFGGLTIASALFVILHKNPVISAVFLVLSFFSLAGLYGVMNAVFIATMQVVVYAGAIMVLVIFVLMLLSLREETLKDIWDKPVKKTIIMAVVAFYSFLLISVLLSRGSHSSEVVQIPKSSHFISDSIHYEYKVKAEKEVSLKGNTASVGASTFLDYLLPFELISILLLAAVVGAVIIAKKEPTQKENS
ncbi:MAG: NADH-quinone oxidoreductase subunit J [Leptospiraceae bacterium]|nr:NADH-quinone oxidoreductase subunit J [Leptospiraceae bacterium]MCP5499520.1 NADH-quinone oxidoreductase subunit J [Leptospiraceae bacterium]